MFAYVYLFVESKKNEGLMLHLLDRLYDTVGLLQIEKTAIYHVIYAIKEVYE